MSHVFFFSYANVNKDKELEKFFEDLCDAVKKYTPFAARDDGLSFRDRKNLRLMDDWHPELMDALQTSHIMVSMTSYAYFESRYCGQEYWVFNERRKKAGHPSLPRVILPVIWAPSANAHHPLLDPVQLKMGEMHELYAAKGLWYLMKIYPNEYDRCVTLFAESIGMEWQLHRDIPIPRLEGITSFRDIPNPFASDEHDEAMTSRGLTPGPGVANFVFAAATKNHFPDPRGRYRDKPSEWCPYFPPENHKIINLARQVAHRQHIEFREIRIDQHLEIELKSACERKNLTLVVADAQSLEHCSAIKVFDPEDWQGTAVLMPWHGGREAFEHHRSNISLTFPIRSREASRPFLAPIETKAEFESRLEITLTELQAAVINAGAVGRGNPDDPPAILVGPGGGG